MAATYDALLDEHEDEATFDCGCRMVRNEESGQGLVEFYFCPGHKVSDHHIHVGVRGGLVQYVDSVPPGVTVHVIDYDTEGSGDDELCSCDRAEDEHSHEEFTAGTTMGRGFRGQA